jgi:hypothetical protein
VLHVWLRTAVDWSLLHLHLAQIAMMIAKQGCSIRLGAPASLDAHPRSKPLPCLRASSSVNLLMTAYAFGNILQYAAQNVVLLGSSCASFGPLCSVPCAVRNVASCAHLKILSQQTVGHRKKGEPSHQKFMKIIFEASQRSGLCRMQDAKGSTRTCMLQMHLTGSPQI